MDSYPGDLLTGVFPLVFAVDAILPTTSSPDGDGAAALPHPIQRTSSTRSLFDRFLDAMASYLSDDSDGSLAPKAPSRRSGADSFASLLRGDDMFGGGEEDSSDDEDESTDSTAGRRFRGLGSPSLVVPGMNNTRGIKSTVPRSQSTAFARSLKLDGFFDRARILSISNRHGFPPSKDSTGQMNRTLKLSQARSALAMNPTDANALRLKRVLDTHPIQGILNAGWLEKHAAALPSVLLIVTTFQILDKMAQDEQDAHLVETLEHLRESLASKRACSIRLVCLADTPDQPTTPAKVDEWISRMKKECDLTTADVTMLQISHDLETASPNSQNSAAVIGPMQKLHREIRDASWSYYRSLYRRVKLKLNLLAYDNQPTLLPLAVRYCFKIGVFYEFLLVHTKALKYFYKAYRLLQTYYLHLLGKSTLRNPVASSSVSAIVNPQSDESGGIELALGNNEYGASDDGGVSSGVEVALADDSYDDDDDLDDESDRLQGFQPKIASTVPLDIRKVFTEINAPFDMANQCRKIADWLNFKLLQAGLQSSSFSDSDQGILAASSQWRRHCQVFLKHDDLNDPAWSYWSYVSHQRLVMSQLVERFPPRKLTSLSGLVRDEVLMQCSAWRNYMASAEATLRVGVEVRKAVVDVDAFSTAPLAKANLRGRFIGSMDSEGLAPLLHDEAKRDHTEIALDMLTRAVARFEKELEKSEMDDDNGDGIPSIQDSSHRAGARIYYLFGGVLLGKKAYKEAIVFLEKAVKYSKGWEGLELVIRRMLIECYERHLPSQTTTTDEQTSIIASMILDSYFNSQMSSRNLRRALDSFSSLSGGGMMKWHRDCIDESSTSLPFSFAVTFPRSTHATAGDEATASVMIKSNLDYAVHINSVTLLSMAGDIQIPSDSLLGAENASEGVHGGIIIQANASIVLATQIEVPKTLDSIATDEGGNGGETQGTAGKGSFAKLAKPRTAGLTSGGGARLISENLFQKGPQDRNAQWSIRYLGGKPLRCDGIRLVFYPVHVEKVAATGGMNKVNVIELTIEKKRPSTTAVFKRTPFEEDNYLSSAWSRPDHLPLWRGPRCLRVLGPMPEMTVINLTEELSGGKAMEGTVNRVLLKLQAGPNELCENIRFQVRCSSMLLSPDGVATHLNAERSVNDEEKVVSNSSHLRTPVLVCQGEAVTNQVYDDVRHRLPRGWRLVGTDCGTPTTVQPSLTNLKPGEETFVYFDVYRPHRMLGPFGKADDFSSTQTSDVLGEGDALCQTDFDICIFYTQARPKAQRHQGRRRRKPTADSVASEEKSSNDSDVVTLAHTVSMTWASPLLAEFSYIHDAQNAPPAGSRHRSNLVTPSEEATTRAVELALVDGERVSTRCSLWANGMPSAVGIDVSRVWFTASAKGQCDFRLIGPRFESSSLFDASESDVCHLLGNGKKMGVMLTVDCYLRDEHKHNAVSTNMGVLCVDWAPKPLSVPPAAEAIARIQCHGPLPLHEKSTMMFRGPACSVECAPFETSVAVYPSAPRVGSPFEVVFSIVNKTCVHQQVSVSLQDTGNVDVLVAGYVNGELQLSPQATQLLSYTVIATKAGKVSVPSISIASSRYQTWLVRSSGSSDLFVLPS